MPHRLTVFDYTQTGYGEGFTLECEGGLVFFEGAVDSDRANGQELLGDGGSNAESRPLWDKGHLLADEECSELRTFGPTTFIPERTR
jgi:hypothetical protein